MEEKNSLVSLAIEDKLGIIIINNPPLNVLNSIVLGELSKTLDYLSSLKGIQTLIITGAGDKAFAAGADINQFPQLDEISGKAMVELGQKIFDKISEFSIPVICAINGYALGGGCELALACDIRIAAENAYMGLPEVSLGIIPGYGGTQRLPRLIGAGKAKELIFSGKSVSAEEAYRIGLVEKLVQTGEALKAAKDLAQTIMKRGPLAVSKAKHAINQGLKVTLQEGLKIEAKFFSQLCTSKDQKEGAEAFLNKRPPIFKGQ